MNLALYQKIQISLESIRHFLQADNVDVELVNVSEDGIVEVRLLGSCSFCPLSKLTLRAGIERALMNDLLEVKRVEQVI